MGVYACPRFHLPPGIVIARGLVQPYLFLCFNLSQRESVGEVEEGVAVGMGLEPAGRRLRRVTVYYSPESGSAMRLPAWGLLLHACGIWTPAV